MSNFKQFQAISSNFKQSLRAVCFVSAGFALTGCVADTSTEDLSQTKDEASQPDGESLGESEAPLCFLRYPYLPSQGYTGFMLSTSCPFATLSTVNSASPDTSYSNSCSEYYIVEALQVPRNALDLTISGYYKGALPTTMTSCNNASVTLVGYGVDSTETSQLIGTVRTSGNWNGTSCSVPHAVINVPYGKFKSLEANVKASTRYALPSAPGSMFVQFIEQKQRVGAEIKGNLACRAFPSLP